MLPTEDLFVHVYYVVHEAIRHGGIRIPARPGPKPACTDAELMTIELVRRLLGRRYESTFFAEVACDWPHLFPCLPDQSEVNRRLRWLWGAFEQLRAHRAAQIPPDDWGQIDTSAIPVTHCSRVRGPDAWAGPGDLVAGFGRDGAHAEWFYGFRLAILTDLGSRIVRSWGIVPAAVNEREVALGLVDGLGWLVGLLCDKGFNGAPFAAEMATLGIAVLVPPTKAQRKTMPKALQEVIAKLRNRVETCFYEITDRMELARHGARTFWGLLMRTASAIAAHTILLTGLAETA